LQRWSNKKCSVAGYAADGEQQSPPGGGVSAAFRWVRHWLQKSIRISLHVRHVYSILAESLPTIGIIDPAAIAAVIFSQTCYWINSCLMPVR
jgi:hypothetical protein